MSVKQPKPGRRRYKIKPCRWCKLPFETTNGKSKGHRECYLQTVMRPDPTIPNATEESSKNVRLSKIEQENIKLKKLTGTAPREIENLKDTLRRTQIQLDESKRKNAELVQATYQAVHDAVSSVTIPDVPKPRLKKGKLVAETALCLMSDWQLGKKTTTYSSAICAKRIQEYANKVLHLTAIQRAHHPVNECRVYLLGDLVEGELIFPGQAWKIDASLYQQVAQDGPEILAKLLRQLASDFDKVHVVGVIGNHGQLGGRSWKEYSPESNADAMMYEITRKWVSGEPRITWSKNSTKDERHWYAVDRVGEKGFLLFHGDQVKGGALGYPWYGFGKKILGWANGGIKEKFDYALSGHFHTPVRGLYGQIRHWGSGSTESDNTYAAEYFSAMGSPSQWLLYAHPQRGVSAEYEVHLT